jgi:hypothetical protein
MPLCKVAIIRHQCCEVEINPSDSTPLVYVLCLLTFKQHRTSGVCVLFVNLSTTQDFPFVLTPGDEQYLSINN